MRGLLTCVLWLALVIKGGAQTGQTVFGVVEDESGAVLAGATVTVQAGDGGAVGTVVTDGQGAFRVSGARAGRHSVTVTLPYFERAVADVIVQDGREPAALRLVLRVAGVREAVSVGVDRLQISRDESPARVSVLRRRDLDALPIRDGFDALALLPNVDVRRAGGPLGEGSLTLYGISGQPFAPTANVLAVNGVPLNNGLVPDTSLNMLPFVLVERLELVQGPGSSAFGSNAMTGVLNFVTRRASRGLQGSARATVGTRWSTMETEAYAGGGRGDDYGWVVGGSYRSTDGHLQPSGRLNFSDADKRNVAFIGDRRLGGFRFFTGVVYYRSDEHNPDVRTPRRAQRVETGRRHVNAGASRAFGRGIDVQATFVHNAFDGQSRETFDTTVYGFGPTASRPGDPSDQSAYSNGVIGRAEWSSRRNLLTAGAETHAARATDNLTNRIDTGNTRGVFVQDRLLAAGGRLSVALGYRYDKASAYADASSSPKAGAVWRTLNSRWLARGNVSRAFTAPTFSQLFSPGFVRGNPTLVAQTLLLKEGGVEVRPTRALGLGLSVFRMRLDRPIFPRFNAAINATQFTNVSPGSENTGGTVTADYRNGNWLAGVSYTRLDPGSATFHTWRHSTKSQLAYRTTRWSAGGDLRRQTGGYWADGFARPADDYTVVDLMGTYTLRPWLKVVASATNLSDALYATTANIGNVGGVSNNTGIPRPGRYLTIGLEVGR